MLKFRHRLFAMTTALAVGTIARLAASRLSLMPQELEKGMTAQEMADLLAYLRGEP